MKNTGGQHLHYNINKQKRGQFDIIHDISEKIALVQLMDSVGNVNHAMSIFGYRTFDSTYKKALPLTLDSLNLICSTLLGEVMFDMFEKLFHAVRYINNTGKLKYL